MPDVAAEKLIVGHGPLAEFLTAAGFPITKNTIAKYCSPTLNIGPPVRSYWGLRPAFSPEESLAWARSRMRPANTVRSMEVPQKRAL
jgi:hypothetical protein